MSNAIETLTVDLGERSYPIEIGANLIETAGSRIVPRLSGRQVIVVTDQNVAPLWLDKLTQSFSGFDVDLKTVVLPASETTKAFDPFKDLLEEILSFGIDRKTTLVALGGGVVGDITGFAAAVLLRGIDFIQIPTSLLAQVDSSVGGKTGINTTYGKNLVGAFHQPILVLADIGALDTLPKRELLAGYAEVVKYGLIDDFDFYEWCETNGKRVIDGDTEARRYAVLKSCEAKARIVAVDEKEAGKRALLNLGHTFGHAFEAEAGYGSLLLHGEAVAIGSLQALALSVALGLCEKQEYGRVYQHYQEVGLPYSLAGIATDQWSVEKLLGHMSKDKKVEAGQIKFILAKGIGKAFVTADVPKDELSAILKNALVEARNN